MGPADTPLVQLLTEATRDRDRIGGELAELAKKQRELKGAYKDAVKRIEDLLGDLVEPRPLLDRIEEVVEERPDGAVIPAEARDIPETAPDIPAWRSLSLLDLVADAPWPGREAAEAARSARLALAEPAGNAPGVTTLGQLIDVIEGNNGSIGGPIEDMVITRPDGEPGVDGFFTEAEVKALRFAMHSRREVDPEFAAAVEAWVIDPTLRRLLFRVELKRGKEKREAYLRANSKLIATEYAQANWGDAFKSIWEINADKPPEGATVFDIPLDSYDDRRAQYRLEERVEEHERQEKAARAKAEKEPEPGYFSVTPKGKKRAPLYFVRARTLAEAVAYVKTERPNGKAMVVKPWFDELPKGAMVCPTHTLPAKEA